MKQLIEIINSKNNLIVKNRKIYFLFKRIEKIYQLLNLPKIDLKTLKIINKNLKDLKEKLSKINHNKLEISGLEEDSQEIKFAEPPITHILNKIETCFPALTKTKKTWLVPLHLQEIGEDCYMILFAKLNIDNPLIVKDFIWEAVFTFKSHTLAHIKDAIKGIEIYL
ncbi:hypothetical protein A2483_03130 [Candidatus Peregrinibacteria bacterium RIFOXYC2_FULL_33_13]|nr:MAG: hypothetical protein UR30_C0002G0003 [Candidatus Peregrinibacteria bacterium GW2011_GWC2_33_13]OGJ54482.1 MAG: hypothetical protein A2483_03130 [Candidatus Peregrinibacteria bacterium RIFOXYC2_FULL_33_13]